MGSDDHDPAEAPAHCLELQGFRMDRAPVTNAQFLRNVKATGHLTVAELFAGGAGMGTGHLGFRCIIRS